MRLEIRPFTSLALALTLALLPGMARASEIRDQARIFSPDAVRRAEAELQRAERETQVHTTIETIETLDGKNIGDVSLRLAEASGKTGVFVLISKKEHKIDVRTSSRYAHAFNDARSQNVRESFIASFKKKDFDGGLASGVSALDRELRAARAANGGSWSTNAAARPARRVVAVPPQPVQGRGTFGMGSLIGLGVAVLVGLILIRALGSMFGGGGYGYAGRPGPMNTAYGPGGGPGFGPGYGYGGGGGFFSSLFGGIGGALAGNWLYDQFSGRHHHGGGTYAEGSAYDPGTGAQPESPDTWSGGGHVSGDWGDAGDAGGGDWGGGGGDWGGGGGDWGGGGDSTGGDW